MQSKEEQIEFYRAKLLQMSFEYDELDGEVMEAEQAYHGARRRKDALDDQIYKYEQELKALLDHDS